MQRVLLLFVFSLFCCSCIFLSPQSPEEAIIKGKNLSLSSVRAMAKEGFDFTALSPLGKSYLEEIFTQDSANTRKILDYLCQEKVLSPKVLIDGKTLFSIVLQTPSPAVLGMAKKLLASEMRSFYLSTNPYLAILGNQNSYERSRLIEWLLEEKDIPYSFFAKDPKTGEIPAYIYLSLYAGENPPFFKKVLDALDPTLWDRQGNNIWHYLFANPSSVLFKVALSKLSDSVYTGLFAKEKKENTSLEVLVSNSKAPRVFELYLKIKPFFSTHYKDQTFLEHLFAQSLKNTGDAFAPLIQELLQFNPPLDFEDEKERNSFLLVLSNPRVQSLRVLNELLKRGVDIYKIDVNGEGYLPYVLRNEGPIVPSLISLLERQGLSFFADDSLGNGALSYAVENKGPYASKNLQNLFENYFSSVLLPDAKGNTALSHVFTNESSRAFPMLRAIVYSNYQGKNKEPYSRLVIFDAARARGASAPKMMLTLFQQGFDPYALNKSHQNALFMAVQNEGLSTPSLVRLLIAKGLPVNTIDGKGNNLLYYAFRNPFYRFALFDLLLPYFSKESFTTRNNAGVSVKDLFANLSGKEDKERFRKILQKHGFVL